MQNVAVVSFQTKQKLLLQGLWIGPTHPAVVYIFIHGLGSSLFSQIDLAQSLVAEDTAILTFNNRGNGLVTGIKKVSNAKKGYSRVTLGAAHEVFTDCIDDIDGAVTFAQSQGAARILLVGHSTGSQKSVYYLYKKKASPVAGAVLLAPMSDYSVAAKDTPPKILARAVAYARKLVAAGTPHDLLPPSVWPHLYDAQRFLSLHTPESVEEIFSYAQPHKKPTILRGVQKPLLVVLAGADEYADRPTQEIATWFTQVAPYTTTTVATVDDSSHNFNKQEQSLKHLITNWAAKVS